MYAPETQFRSPVPIRVTLSCVAAAAVAVLDVNVGGLFRGAMLGHPSREKVSSTRIHPQIGNCGTVLGVGYTHAPTPEPQRVLHLESSFLIRPEHYTF